MNELGIGAQVAGYRIEEVLGRGGMGVVYRAVDDRLGRSAAVKVIAPGQAGDVAFRRRFIEESRAAAAIDHPNVLPVYEAGEEDGVLFLVTRMVEGADLSALLGRDGAMEVSRALVLAGQVAAALDAAHARGLIHRDVKPANVLVARDPGPGTEHCYLTDFGLAQQGDSRTRLTTTGQFVGTLDYIAPEQIQGGTVDGRADVYALAALFYECATGSPPFVRDSQPALLFAHLSDPPPPISEQVEGAPAALDGVIERAMAKAPEDRFATCTEFIGAARAALGGTAPDRAGARPPAGGRDGGRGQGPGRGGDRARRAGAGGGIGTDARRRARGTGAPAPGGRLRAPPRAGAARRRARGPGDRRRAGLGAARHGWGRRRVGRVDGGAAALDRDDLAGAGDRQRHRPAGRIGRKRRARPPTWSGPSKARGARRPDCRTAPTAICRRGTRAAGTCAAAPATWRKPRRSWPRSPPARRHPGRARRHATASRR